MSPRAAEHADSIAAWAKTSRFHALGVVLDLRAADTPELLRALKSAEALAAVRLARRQGLPFVVLAGQLLRKRAGCFALCLADAEALPAATLAAAGRLGDLGESVSLWFVVADAVPREAVLSALAGACATEGSA